MSCSCGGSHINLPGVTYRFMVIFSDGTERQLFASDEAAARKLASQLEKRKRIVRVDEY